LNTGGELIFVVMAGLVVPAIDAFALRL